MLIIIVRNENDNKISDIFKCSIFWQTFQVVLCYYFSDISIKLLGNVKKVEPKPNQGNCLIVLDTHLKTTLSGNQIKCYSVLEQSSAVFGFSVSFLFFFILTFIYLISFRIGSHFI